MGLIQDRDLSRRISIALICGVLGMTLLFLDHQHWGIGFLLISVLMMTREVLR